MAKQNDLVHLDTLFPKLEFLFLLMIRSNYTKSPNRFSPANQSSSIRLRSRSFCVRSRTEEAKACRLRNDGSQCDISPTLLAILKLDEPKERPGEDLRVPLAAKSVASDRNAERPPDEGGL
jgi:hypothetical protein